MIDSESDSLSGTGRRSDSDSDGGVHPGPGSRSLGFKFTGKPELSLLLWSLRLGGRARLGPVGGH